MLRRPTSDCCRLFISIVEIAIVLTGDHPLEKLLLCSVAEHKVLLVVLLEVSYKSLRVSSQISNISFSG